MTPQELVKKAVKGKIKQGERFFIINNGVVDPVKYLKFDVDAQGTLAFICVEPKTLEFVADSSVLLSNEFEPMDKSGFDTIY